MTELKAGPDLHPVPQSGLISQSFKFEMSRPLLFLLLCAMLSWCACNPILYFPDRAATPGLTAAGQATVLGTVKLQRPASSDTQFQDGHSFAPAFDAAVSPLNHLGLAVAYRTVYDRQGLEDPDAFLIKQYGGVFRGDRWEASAGYYATGTDRTLYEVYGGYSQGRLRRRGTLRPDRDFDARYRQYFIQPAIGWTLDREATLRTGLRITAQQVTAITGPDPAIAYAVDIDRRRNVLSAPSWLAQGFVDFTVPYWMLLFTMQTGLGGVVAGPKVREGLPLYL